MTPITRLEQFIIDAVNSDPELSPVTRVEHYLYDIASSVASTMTPITRIETYLAKISGADVAIPAPVTRIEMYLAAIAGEDIETPIPVTRLEYFLADWAAAGGASLETVTGNAPVTLLNAVAKAIVSLTQTGLCTQADTPTPSAPVDIKCNNGVLKLVDDELPAGFKRLASIKFDGDFWYETGEVMTGNDDVTMTLSGTVTTGQNVFGSYNGTSEGTKNFSLYLYGGGSTSNCYLRYGEQLLRPRFGSGERTITFGKSGTSGFYTDVTAEPDTFTTVAGAFIGMLPNSSSPAYTGSIVGNILVGTRLKWIPCERESDGVVGYYEAVKGVFLEPVGTGSPVKGEYDFSLSHIDVVGTPETLTVGGKNLNGGTIEHIGFTSTGASSTSDTFAGTGTIIPCVAGEKYTVSFGGFTTSGISGVFVNTWKTDGTFNLRQAISSTGETTFTIPDGVNKVNFTLYKTGGATIDSTSWMQVERGASATPYEPYVEPQTASVVNLLSAGNYADTQEIISGAVNRKVGIKVFNGSETVTSSSGGTWATPISDKLKSKVFMWCSHYPYSSESAANAPDKSFVGYSSQNIGFKDSDFTQSTDVTAFFKDQYDAGTPVIIVYPLIEDVTESVAGQHLSTAEGTNVVNVTAEVSQIALEVEYYAKSS